MNIYKILEKERYFLLVILILAFIIRGIVFSENSNHVGDGMYRTILAMNWLKNPYFIKGDLWPPLQLYMSAFMIYIWGDPFVSTRLISLIFGILIIFPYYYLVKLLFDKNVATVATLILIFIDVHIQYSTFAMSEVPFIFFLVASLYFFFRFKRSDIKKEKFMTLIVSAIFLSLASMIRYEAWLFIPLLSIFIISTNLKSKIYDIYNTGGMSNSGSIVNKDTNRNYIYLSTFLIISLIFPVFWMIGNYNLHGDFAFGQTWSDKWIRTNAALNPDTWYNTSIMKRLTIWPGVIINTLNIMSIFAFIGLSISIIKRRNLEFLTIFSILMLIFIYKTVGFTMLRQPRHIIMPIVFLIPYSSIGLDLVLGYISSSFERYFGKDEKIGMVRNSNIRKIILFMIIGVFIVNSSHIAIAKNPYMTPSYIYDISNWLKNNVRADETVLLDEYNWWGLHILYYSGFNTTFTGDYLDTFEFVTDQVRIVAGGGKKIDDKIIVDYLKGRTYLVYHPKGKLKLNFSQECKNEIKFGYSFECKYSTNDYRIYKISRIDTWS